MDANETNKYFKEKAAELGVKVAYEFEAGALVQWYEVVENMMVLLKAQMKTEIRNHIEKEHGYIPA